MTLRFIKQRHIFQGVTALVLIFLFSCSKPKKQEYAYNAKGYYYKLISFDTDTFRYRPHAILQLAASFSTQSDSVFWDSYNNLNDNFFIEADSSSPDFLRHYSSLCDPGDSACLLIKPADFFQQQFKTSRLPYFSRTDSVVKVNFRLKRVMSALHYQQLNKDLETKEQEQIRNFYGSEAAYTAAADAAGFYWVTKPGKENNAGLYKAGAVITLAYTGSYLNGRFLEASPEKFEVIYGTPGQLLKGLNIVIGRIKIGQNAKIILPSRLAFGENGSTNGSVPPFTPLLYEIKITDVKE